MEARNGPGESRTLSPKDFFINSHSDFRIRSARALKAREFAIHYKIDCRHLVLEASLDFDYILSLEHRGDLRVLADFCKVRYKSAGQACRSFTRVTLCDLKDFVVRELSASRTNARNVVFKSGKEQFLWRLARSSPIRDDIPEDLPRGFLHAVPRSLRTRLIYPCSWSNGVGSNRSPRSARLSRQGPADTIGWDCHTGIYRRRWPSCSRLPTGSKRNHLSRRLRVSPFGFEMSPLVMRRFWVGNTYSPALARRL